MDRIENFMISCFLIPNIPLARNGICMGPTTGRVVQVMPDSRSSHVQVRFMSWGVLLISKKPP